MERFGPHAFWLVLCATFSIISAYALYRMTQRAVVPTTLTESYLNVLPTASVIAVEAAGVWAAENAEAAREAEAEAEAEREAAAQDAAQDAAKDAAQAEREAAAQDAHEADAKA
jgi:hypothetical protein